MIKAKGTNFLKVSWNNLFWQRHDERFHALFEQPFLCRVIIGDLASSVRLDPIGSSMYRVPHAMTLGNGSGTDFGAS